MRLTPAELGMRLIATGSAPMHSYPAKANGIAHGRHLLRRCTARDYGYDLKSWHDYLAGNKRYAPYSRKKPGQYPNMIMMALANPHWIEAVRIAESTKLFETIKSEHQQMRDATSQAERRWSGQQRKCPKCETAFVSVQNRGQCPQCRFIFMANNPGNAPDGWRGSAG